MDERTRFQFVETGEFQGVSRPASQQTVLHRIHANIEQRRWRVQDQEESGGKINLHFRLCRVS